MRLSGTIVTVMLKFLTAIEFVASILLIASVLLQHRGTGLGGAFASEANAYRSKRGIERFLSTSTIVLGILIALSSLVHLYFALTISS